MIHLVGDVQGCAEAFDRLLETIGFSPSRDRLIVLGDLVNRGPDSLAVLRRLAALDGTARCLLGNHDLHLLAVAHGVRPLHDNDTFGDVLAAPDRARWIDWIRRQPLALLESGWLCVHAGVLPQWDTGQTIALAAEVHALLSGPDLAGFLPLMYGNEPRRWDDALAGPDRWRLVINTLTRARYCRADGALDFKVKAGPAAAPVGLVPWFDVAGRRTAAQPIAFGHWSTLGLLDRPRLLAIDTGCVWGGALTAVRIDGGRREVVHIRCTQAQRPGLDR
jgi:bis(5'-nucleosyl)-tetraphosphatase (symmetrical)